MKLQRRECIVHKRTLNYVFRSVDELISMLLIGLCFPRKVCTRGDRSLNEPILTKCDTLCVFVSQPCYSLRRYRYYYEQIVRRSYYAIVLSQVLCAS